MSGKRSPQIRPDIKPIVFKGEGVILLRDGRSEVMYGQLYEELIPLLSGDHTLDYILNHLKHQFNPDHILFTLINLQAKGYLCHSVETLSDEASAFWSALDLDPEHAQELINTSSVSITSIGDADKQEMKEALELAGIPVTDDHNQSSLIVVVCDDYLSKDLLALNKDMRKNGRTWLLIRTKGNEPLIGPLYRHNQLGCHECLARRLSRHRLVENFVALKKGYEGVARFRATPPCCSASRNLAVQAGTLEIAKILSNASTVCESNLVSLNIHTLKTDRHHLSADPNCVTCGRSVVKNMDPIVLQSSLVHFSQDGGYRNVTPEETLASYEQFISPITGIVRELTEAPTKLKSVKVYHAGHNSALSIRNFANMRKNLRSNSSGKGASEVQAKVSALCEALERFSAEIQGDEIMIYSSICDMQEKYGSAVIHPNKVMRYSDSQYKERESINSANSHFNIVPDPLEDDDLIHWTPLWSLTKQEKKYLPSSLLYFKRPSQDDGFWDKFIALACSNGNASGNSIEEAVLHGLLELIERDCTAIWWYNMLRKPELDIESFNDNWFQQSISDYHSIDRDIWALDLTSDLGIPCFAALSKNREGEQEQILLGLGCSLDPRIALQRAIAEMNQMLTAILFLPEGLSDDETVHWLQTAKLKDHSYLKPDPTKEKRRATDFVFRNSRDLLDDIKICKQKLENKGMEILVLDQTRELIKLPVVRVIVPGLRHFWARYGAGRLYDVPVNMGWLNKPLTEDELNPVTMFF